ncbi:hypothetical protein HK097_002405, partial [Rhizophlyctis rosea]
QQGDGSVVVDEMRYVVVYPHFPRMSDEVELNPGDIVAVKKIYKDGWCRGTNLNTGNSGVFPLFAVEDESLEGNDENVQFIDLSSGDSSSSFTTSSFGPENVTEASTSVVSDTSMMKAGFAAAIDEFGLGGEEGKGKGKERVRGEQVPFVMPPVESVGRESLDVKGADEPSLIDVERASPKGKKKAQLL